MRHKFLNQIAEGEFEIFIRGIIGLDVSGREIAEQIDLLNEQGATKIIERINSAGGDVIDGFNIVSANLRSKATIETVNEGVAASMGAIILASGDKRKALDFSTALIHDPQTAEGTLEKIEDENRKSNLQKIKNSLVKILTDACGKPENIISELMTRETVLSSKEQKEFGLIDEVLKSRIKKPSLENLSLTEIMNVCNNLNTNHKIKNSRMEKLTKFLNLNPDASENSILDAVNLIKKNADGFRNEFENTQEKLIQTEQDLKEANEKLTELSDIAIENAVNNAISSGKFTEENREKLLSQARKNLDFFNEMIELTPIIGKSALGEIKNEKKNGEEKIVKDWDYYQKNEPEILKNMETSDPEQFKRLFEDYHKETL